MVVTVLSRPFDDDSDALAMAAPLQSFDNYRPVQGFIYCNILKAPVKIESETSSSRYSFNTYLHEMFHVLAFSLDLFPISTQLEITHLIRMQHVLLKN